MYLRVSPLSLDESFDRQVRLLYLLSSIRPLPNIIPHPLYVINVVVREVGLGENVLTCVLLDHLEVRKEEMDILPSRDASELDDRVVEKELMKDSLAYAGEAFAGHRTPPCQDPSSLE